MAASEKDAPALAWALIRVREASITRHSASIARPPLDDPALVRGGARAYVDLGCTSCHGGLGAKPALFSKGLNPQPNLKAVIKDIKPEEIFWVLKNGIRMSGMPSFGSGATPVPDRDLWSIAAFLKQVPSLSDEDFKAWSAAH